MEACHVLVHALVTITPEALVAVGAPQFAADLGSGALGQLGIIDRPGGVADHRQTGTVHLLAGGLPWQQAAQRAAQPHDRVLRNGEGVGAIAVVAEQIEALERLEGRLDQADRAGVALGQAVVPLVAALPDAVVGDAVGAGHVIGEVLDEVALVAGLHHHQTGAGELGQLQQEQGRGIELQMAPAVIGNHRLARAGVELGVDRVEGIEAALEALHLLRLAQHRAEQSTHQLQHPLLELVDAPAGTVEAPVSHRQAPDALNRVDAVAHPGIAVVAMHGAGGAGGQETRERMLAAEHHLLDLLVEALQQLAGLGVRQRRRGRLMLRRRVGMRVRGGAGSGSGAGGGAGSASGGRVGHQRSCSRAARRGATGAEP